MIETQDQGSVSSPPGSLPCVRLAAAVIVFSERTRPDGSFHFRWLGPDWHGTIDVEWDGGYAVDGDPEERVLSRPVEGLVLSLRLRPAFVGTVVRGAQVVPEAGWTCTVRCPAAETKMKGSCDSQGRFRIPIDCPDPDTASLTFRREGSGIRILELTGVDGNHDIFLGDVELSAVRDLPFIVRSTTGTLIAVGHLQWREYGLGWLGPDRRPLLGAGLARGPWRRVRQGLASRRRGPARGRGARRPTRAHTRRLKFAQRFPATTCTPRRNRRWARK